MILNPFKVFFGGADASCQAAPSAIAPQIRVRDIQSFWSPHEFVQPHSSDFQAASKNLSGLTGRDVTTVYSKTSKGIRALNRKDRRLPANLMRVLALVDGKSTAEEISAKSRDISPTELRQALTDLAADGYLKALASGPPAESLSDPGLAAAILVAETGEEDFFKELAKIETRKTAGEIAGQQRRGSARTSAEEAGANVRAERQTHNEPQKQRRSDARLPAGPIAETPCGVAGKTGENTGCGAREEAEEKARARARANRRLEARAREAAERKAREEAEAREKEEARERARQEAEEAARAEQAAREKAEAEARIREEAERRAREEAECRARAKAEAKAKAEAEERTRRAAEEAARAERAAKARALAEAERKAREKAEEEERERAEIEARARALADLRVLEEEKARQKAASNARKARKPVEWGRMALVSLAALAVLPLMSLHLVNLKAFIPAIEKIAEDKLHEPVAIGSLHVSLWPAPHLRLEEVTVGKARDVKIAAIRVMPELGALFEDAGTLKSIEVDALLLDQDTLPRVIGWVGSGGASGNARVGRIGLKNTKIALKGVPLPPLNADIALTATGKFDGARIASADGKIEIEVAPKNGEFDVHVAAKGWQPPLGPRITFEELTARATANREGMRISEIRGRLFEGAAKGAATVKWDEFWTVEGHFNVSRIALEAAMPALAGDVPLSGWLDAEAAYSMKAGSLAGLFDAPRIRASFSGRDGVVGNIDLARAVQARTAEAIKGGQTRFASLSGNMTLTDGRYQFRKMELSAGQFNAGGEADVAPGRALSGKLDAEVKLKANVIRAHLALSGNLKQPVLRREGQPPVPAR